MDTPVDYYGSPIVPNAKIAYNYKGKVRYGIIESVRNVMRGGKLTRQWAPFEPFLEIKVIQNNGEVSKVTNRTNLVVLN